ncbi:MAG: hypothetical protein GEU28_07125 [Dehalococcoidia bacterium]|nr:hypothetical protein [Dehalococcoidia bacterium]
MTIMSCDEAHDEQEIVDSDRSSSRDDERDYESQDSDEPEDLPEGLPDDPLDQMELAFDGGYGRAEIKRVIDEAMLLYGLPLSEGNYSRAGSVVVALSNEFGFEEMDILRYMIRSYVPGVEVSFADAAALSVTFMASGYR